MKSTLLTKDEQDLLNAYQNDLLMIVENEEEEKQQAQLAAQNTISHHLPFSFEIQRGTLLELEKMAHHAGISETMLINAVLEEYLQRKKQYDANYLG